MEPIDGNSLAGAMFEYFGTEMTSAWGSCRYCGTSAQVAELRVYPRAPGTVVRCRSCGNVVIVLVEIDGSLEVSLSGFRLAEDFHRPTGA